MWIPAIYCEPCAFRIVARHVILAAGAWSSGIPMTDQKVHRNSSECSGERPSHGLSSPENSLRPIVRQGITISCDARAASQWRGICGVVWL